MIPRGPRARVVHVDLDFVIGHELLQWLGASDWTHDSSVSKRYFDDEGVVEEIFVHKGTVFEFICISCLDAFDDARRVGG